MNFVGAALVFVYRTAELAIVVCRCAVRNEGKVAHLVQVLSELGKGKHHSGDILILRLIVDCNRKKWRPTQVRLVSWVV